MRGVGKAVLVGVIALAHLAGFAWLAGMRVAPTDPAQPELATHAPDPPPPRAPRDQARPPAPEPEATPTSPKTIRADEQPTSETSGEPGEPLPPADTPLMDALAQLEARARRGDSRAQCRLALDSELCRRSAETQQTVDVLEDAAARASDTDPRAIARIASAERAVQRGATVCRGLPDGWAESNAWQHLRDAAQTNPNLATRFALAPPLDWRLADLQPEAWQAYRDAAPGLLLRAAQAGDPRAIFTLQRAYSGQAVLQDLPQAFAPDPRLAMVYALALLGVSDPHTATELQAQIDAGRIAFDAQAWSDIETEAQSLAAEHLDELEAPIDFTADPFAAAPESGICD